MVCSFDESVRFDIETKASGFAIAETFNQAGRPLEFFYRTPQGPGKCHLSIEKEPQTIIETVRHWKHYLIGGRFSLKTDQRSVAYMFDRKQRGKLKLKKDKIMRWGKEFSCYNFDFMHRPGEKNIPPDTLSRGNCDVMNSGSLDELHQALCHPGVTQIFHFIISRNLPYSMEDLKRMIRSCHICAECKP